MAAGRKSGRRKFGFVTFTESYRPPSEYVSIRQSAEALERLRDSGVTPAGLAKVRTTWEETCHHDLGERSEEFLAHPDAKNLAMCTPALLKRSAAVAVRNNAEGHLLLSEWWKVACERVGVFSNRG